MTPGRFQVHSRHVMTKPGVVMVAQYFAKRWGIRLLAGISSTLVSTTAIALEPSGWSGEPLVEEAVKVISNESSLSHEVNGKPIRIAFYNIEMFTDGIKDGKNRTEDRARNQAKGAASIITELHADILIISEIENERALNLVNDSLEEPYPSGYIVQFGSGSGRLEKMNIGLLARYPVESVHEIDFGPLSGAHRPTRGLLRVIASLGNNDYLLLYGAHLKANWGDRTRNYAQRTNALELLKQDIQRVTEQHPDRSWETILVGDFNTDPLLRQFDDDPTLKTLDQWTDLFSQHPDISDLYTVPTRHGDPMREFPPALFDRVLVHPEVMEKPWQASLPGVIMKGTVTEDVNVLPGQGSHVSDHYPVYLDLMP